VENYWKKTIVLLIAVFFIAGLGIFLLSFPSARSVFVETIKHVAIPVVVDPNADIAEQKPLANPPHPIKAIYLTAWSAGNFDTVTRALNLIRDTELNAVVIDVKDYTGVVSYKPKSAVQVIEYGAFEERIKKINSVIKRFHDEGVYVIGRVAVFEDQALVAARPEFALKSKKSNGGIWGDRKGIKWLDTSVPAVWDYNIEIAKDAFARGFDEVNLDYIRFPTDGDTADIIYPHFDEKLQTRRQVLQQFFKHVRDEIPYGKLSADIFGETTMHAGTLVIGQHLEDPFLYFDAVAPMIYPSHFGPGSFGYAKPAEMPYEIIRASMDNAFLRITDLRKNLLLATSTAKMVIGELRPWLQDFDLGADYDAVKVRAQIRAVEDSARLAAGCAPKGPANDLPTLSSTVDDKCMNAEIGWMLWSPGNSYTRGALRPGGNF
jgi:hypothetical protein